MAKSRRYFIAIAALSALLPGAFLLTHGKPSAALTENMRTDFQSGWAVACSGRVEGRHETIDIGAGVDGVVERILVNDGQVVAAGIPLVQLNCADLKARKKQAIAEVESAIEQRKRILRGARDEERRAAQQRRLAAEAVLKEAESRFARTRELAKAQVISDQQYDQVLRELDVARAQLDEARSQETLTLAGPLPEEEAKSHADLDSTRYQLDVVNKQLDKCTVRAPSTGTVLRVLAKPGETFSTVMPRPLVKFADLSTTKVRAEVDERDIGNISIGQLATVSVEALPGKELQGRVSSVMPYMGRKSAISNDPADKADRDVQEVVVDLAASDKPLPVGLRVLVRFATQESAHVPAAPQK